MARRKRIVDEPENQDRWLVSYADFITLLFAFFVVMYSISSVNDGKFRVLSESLEHAFQQPEISPDPIQIGEIRRGPESPIDDLVIIEEPLQKQQDPRFDELEGQGETEALAKVASQMEEILSPYIEQDLIDIERNDLWIEIEMKSALLFTSGRTDLADEATPVLRKIAQILRQMPNPIQVEGYTDNLPISSIEFPSNWELSSARAASVVAQLVQHGVNPIRLAAIGYGEYHPIADNRFEPGRYKNRRVVVVVQNRSVSRHEMASNERSKLMAATPATVNKNN